MSPTARLRAYRALRRIIGPALAYRIVYKRANVLRWG